MFNSYVYIQGYTYNLGVGRIIINMYKYNQSAAEQYYGSFGYQLWFWSDCFFVTYY